MLVYGRCFSIASIDEVKTLFVLSRGEDLSTSPSRAVNLFHLTCRITISNNPLTCDITLINSTFVMAI